MKKIFYFSWLLFSIGQSFGQTGIISTVVGNGIGGYNGDGGIATLAELGLPNGIAIDDSNNIYVVDFGNNVIRKVITKTGIITTIVGTGGYGYQGDGGPATAALLNYPGFICIDKQYNIYFSDCLNNVIRKVTYSTGIINTVAGNGYIFLHAMYPSYWGGYSGDGGQATDAELNCPNGLALDDSDNIYIADINNNVIRKVFYLSGIINTVVGNGYGASIYPRVAGYTGDGGQAKVAELYCPSYLSFDKTDNMFVADELNQVIRKVSTAGVISTVAGNYYYGKGYSGDGGPATAAEFNNPMSVVSDNSGNLYITDDNNSVIRFVDNSSGIITTIAGNHSYGAGYSGNGGPATAAELNFPVDAILDTNGNLFISDEGNYVVREVTQTIATGKNEVKQNKVVSIFPNPSNGIFTLSLSNATEKCNIEIYNIIGEKIYTETLPTKDNNTIDLTGQPNGMYFYRVIKEDGSFVGSGKVIIEK